MLPIEYCSYKIDFVGSMGSAPHSHDITSEIIQCFENSGDILINGELYRMKKNGLYFIHGLDTHFVAPEDLNRYNHSIIQVNTAEAKRILKELQMQDEFYEVFLKKGGMFCELTEEDVIETDKIFLEIDKILKDNEGMKYARLSSALIKLIIIGLKNQDGSNKSNDKLSDIFSIINDNVYNKFTLDEICEKAHISKHHLCRTFKENMGVTITDYIKNRRLSLARQLLMNSNSKVTEIAQKCGFNDSSFFTKVFSGEFGITPTEYRAKYR